VGGGRGGLGRADSKSDFGAALGQARCGTLLRPQVLTRRAPESLCAPLQLAGSLSDKHPEAICVNSDHHYCTPRHTCLQVYLARCAGSDLQRIAGGPNFRIRQCEAELEMNALKKGDNNFVANPSIILRGMIQAKWR
jgi:hypothetical protein